MQAVIDAIDAGLLIAEIVQVVSNKADAGILDRAAKHGIPARHVAVAGRDREAYDAEVSAVLEQAGVQLVLMIGYMRIVSPAFVQRWADRCMNVHPSLLPEFAGGMDLQVWSVCDLAKFQGLSSSI
jgi:folate-dependent phosphoribosylglycinamide formyltransferase PurN